MYRTYYTSASNVYICAICAICGKKLKYMISDTYPTLLADEPCQNEQQYLKVQGAGPLMESLESVRWIILHCSATRADRPYPVEQLLRDHRARGFRTIGYHFYIRRDGTVTRHRRLLEVGAHCRPYNRCSIGLCYEGGLDAQGHPADTRTPEQRKALQQLLVRLHALFPAARITGHRDLPGTEPKACPCFNARREYSWIETLP